MKSSIALLVCVVLACGGNVAEPSDAGDPGDAGAADSNNQDRDGAGVAIDAADASCAWIFDPAIGCFEPCTDTIVDASSPEACP